MMKKVLAVGIVACLCVLSFLAGMQFTLPKQTQDPFVLANMNYDYVRTVDGEIAYGDTRNGFVDDPLPDSPYYEEWFEQLVDKARDSAIRREQLWESGEFFTRRLQQ